MRRIAGLLSLLFLAGCGAVAPKVTVPTIVTQEVDKYVPLPTELLKQWPITMPVDGTWGEAIEVAAQRRASLEKCNAQLDAIAKAQP